MRIKNEIVILLSIFGLIGFMFNDSCAEEYIFNKEPLVPVPFAQLPTGSITPKGWLYNQLRLSAEGMTGLLDEVWEDVGPNSGWLGGTGESWERGPYWCDGLVPLSYILKDQVLIDKAKKWLEAVLSSQREDGYFGPLPDANKISSAKNEGERRTEELKADWWPRMVMLKALQSYYEATKDARVLSFMTKYFRYQLKNLPWKPLRTWTMWAEWRGGENLASIHWLYNRTGEIFLLDLAYLVYKQTSDWTGGMLYNNVPTTHGVNVGMGVKQPAIYYQQSGDPIYLKAVEKGINDLDRSHGQVEGVHSGDEPLHGTDPMQGTELCTVVEYMFSLETILKISGQPKWADKLERLAFNALPAALKPDIKGHQYFQQPNQVICKLDTHNFYNNGPEVLLFGLKPNFGCCAANMHQGWPKFTMHLWLATQDRGLAAAAYAPCEVSATVGRGVPIKFIEETNYPFDETIRFVFQSPSPIKFPLCLRIPGWCKSASIKINDDLYGQGKPESFVIIDREWNTNDVVELNLPMSIRTNTRPNNLIGIERGPLIYALRIGENWRKLRGQDPFADWEVYPTTPWNYGLLINKMNPESSFTIIKNSVLSQPFDSENVPIMLKGKGRKIQSWKMFKNSAAMPPVSPAISNESVEEIMLIPYGAAHLRIAEFPVCSK